MTIEPHDLPNDLRSAHVFIRFGMRIILLALFTAFIGARFGQAMLWISAVLCLISAIVRRERPFGGDLTHWDEGAAYGALYCAASAISVA
ncbi:MAG: hypothetical protein K2W78_01280 [Xanthobacteraceae bacterium]|nr:hypothetical protein [Xanthobacteraceae bacterium]